MPTLTLKLSEKDILGILKPILEEQYGLRVMRMAAVVENEYEDRPGGGSYPKFSNITVEFGDKISTSSGFPHYPPGVR
jgi:hypothetical protein